MNIMLNQLNKKHRFMTIIVAMCIFWIEEFEKYEQPIYIEEDVGFYIRLFSELTERLREFSKRNEKIAIMEQGKIRYLTYEETEKIVSVLLEECEYYKQNVSAMISDKNLKHRF